LIVDLAFVAALGALQTVAFVRTAAWPLQLACIALLAWRVVVRSLAASPATRWLPSASV
jgi:apolipoprotein N-acyltransferase